MLNGTVIQTSPAGSIISDKSQEFTKLKINAEEATMRASNKAFIRRGILSGEGRFQSVENVLS